MKLLENWYRVYYTNGGLRYYTDDMPLEKAKEVANYHKDMCDTDVQVVKEIVRRVIVDA